MSEIVFLMLVKLPLYSELYFNMNLLFFGKHMNLIFVTDNIKSGMMSLKKIYVSVSESFIPKG